MRERILDVGNIMINHSQARRPALEFLQLHVDISAYGPLEPGFGIRVGTQSKTAQTLFSCTSTMILHLELESLIIQATGTGAALGGLRAVERAQESSRFPHVYYAM